MIKLSTEYHGLFIDSENIRSTIGGQLWHNDLFIRLSGHINTIINLLEACEWHPKSRCLEIVKSSAHS